LPIAPGGQLSQRHYDSLSPAGVEDIAGQAERGASEHLLTRPDELHHFSSVASNLSIYLAAITERLAVS